MSAPLAEILALVGRLDDSPGLDTPRERFRRFIAEHVTSVDQLDELLQQSHDRLGEQHARARQDLVLLTGRFLGFDVTYGAYDARRGARLAGHWRSRHIAHIAVDVRSEQSDEDVDLFARTVAALDAAMGSDTDEHWTGLCVTTPFFAGRAALDAILAPRRPRDIRAISTASLIWLARMVASSQVSTDEAVRLLVADADADFLVGVMRRLAGPPGTNVAAAAAQDQPDDRASGFAWPTPDADQPARTGYWMARIGGDDAVSAEQILASVVARRRLLPVSALAPSRDEARRGDTVCFLIDDTGTVMGHAQLDAVISDASQVLRGGRRFSAVFRLAEVEVYETARRVVDQRILDRFTGVSAPAGGAALVPMSAAEFAQVTAGDAAGPEQQAAQARA